MVELNISALQGIANEGRGLAMDAIKQANSGHLGLPLGCAELGAVLWGYCLQYEPNNPRWLNRDRFVLSAGHGSAFLYSFLHLAGYTITTEDLAHFRQWQSCTPGHPEFGCTPGVEATTGPLGQGIGNAVGMAVSQKKAAALFNTHEFTIFDNRIVCLCGDGCLQEGVAWESIALAGHWKLDNLILIYDSNHVTLDSDLSTSQSDFVREKFEAMNWAVQEVDGHDCQAIYDAYEQARGALGKPQLIVIKTMIGKGLPHIEGTSKAHGTAGLKDFESAKKAWGLDPEKQFYVSPTTASFFENRRKNLKKNYLSWLEKFNAWADKNPEKAQWLSLRNCEFNFDEIPTIMEAQATRQSAGKVLNWMAQRNERIVTGSADLFESAKNFITDGGQFSAINLLGRNLFFGIREHAMGAILNGMMYDGIFQVSGSTFLVFSDYLRPAIRVAALAHLPVMYFFTHDSIAVGEDGPTHQPIEQLSSLRSIPNVRVWRPADFDEVVGWFQEIYRFSDGPEILIGSRQNLPQIDSVKSETKRQGVARGAYILKAEKESLRYIILATGSEVHLALEVAQKLGENTRVVSVPCLETFKKQDALYKEALLPSTCTKCIAIEAGRSDLWYAYVGLQGLVIGMDSFGASAPQKALAEAYGFTADACYRKIVQHFND